MPEIISVLLEHDHFQKAHEGFHFSSRGSHPEAATIPLSFEWFLTSPLELYLADIFLHSPTFYSHKWGRRKSKEGGHKRPSPGKWGMMIFWREEKKMSWAYTSCPAGTNNIKNRKRDTTVCMEQLPPGKASLSFVAGNFSLGFHAGSSKSISPIVRLVAKPYCPPFGTWSLSSNPSRRCTYTCALTHKSTWTCTHAVP